MTTPIKINKVAADKWIDMTGVPADPAVRERCTVDLLQEALAELGSARVISATVNDSGIFQPPVPPRLVKLEGSIAGLSSTRMPDVTDLPAFCDVRVEFTGLGGKISTISVWVPLAWNGRLGIANGWLSLWGDIPFCRPLSMAAALRNGFVTATTDSGNREADMYEWAFDENGELDKDLIRNWAYSGVHDMAVVAKLVTRALHGRLPDYSYMAATSLGGKQVMEAATRYPADFDGYWCIDPAFSWTKLMAAGLWPAVVMKELGNIVPSEKFEAFRGAAIDACDGVDGLRDGFVSEFDDCRFDPHTLVGTSTPAGPITAEDAEVMRLIWDGPRRRNGERLWFGIRPGIEFWGPFGLAMSPEYPGELAPGLTLDHFRWISKDPAFDWKTVTFDTFEDFFDRGVEEFAEIATDNADLTGLKQAGGKLILSHAGDDGAIPPEASVDFYNRIASVAGGVEKTASFARLFVVDGDVHSFHKGIGPGLALSTGMVALMDWVENGNPPEKLMAERYDPDTGEVTATRPVFPYPQVTRYRGEGDPNDASNYIAQSI